MPAVCLLSVCLLLSAAVIGHGAATAGELLTVSGERLPTTPNPRFSELLAAHRGRPLLINFWASWCDPCRDEVPALQRLNDRYRRLGLAVITVAVADQMTAAERVFAAHDVRLPLVDDREQTISRAWGVRFLPATLLLDRHHRLRLRARGVVDWDSPHVARQLQARLKTLR